MEASSRNKSAAAVLLCRPISWSCQRATTSTWMPPLWGGAPSTGSVGTYIRASARRATTLNCGRLKGGNLWWMKPADTRDPYDYGQPWSTRLGWWWL